MFTRFRESLTLVLLLVLPFHAFFVTVLTKVFVGQFKDTPLLVSMWKEGILLLLLGIISIELVRQIFHKKEPRHTWYTCDTLDVTILAFVVLGVVVSLVQAVGLKHIAYGVKYDIWPLLLFFAFRRVQWSNSTKAFVLRFLPIVGAIVVGIGFVFMFLPASILEWFGYSEAHSLYMAHKPIAAFQQIGGSGLRRLQSVLSGPNQAGIWLLIPLSMVWAQLVVALPAKLSVGSVRTWLSSHIMLVTQSVFLLLGIIASFSRSAWLGSIAIFIAGLFVAHTTALYRKKILVSLSATMLVLGLGISVLFPHIFTRSLSNSGHLQKPIEAMHTIMNNPFGLGLGSAGPASNHLSDSCVTVEDANITWAQPYPELCVFLGATQLQPTDYTCNCPHITENWFLQIGVELGVLGLLLFIAILYLLLKQLRLTNDPLARSIILAFIGVSVAALFLHAWEDSAIAYTAWILAAISISRVAKSQVIS